MTRIMEIFVIVNALCGIAAFLGVRFIYRRSKDAAKRGFEIINAREDENDEWKQEELPSPSSEDKPGGYSSLPRQSSSSPQ